MKEENFMKKNAIPKMITVVMTATMALGMFGCGNTSSSSAGSANSAKSDTAEADAAETGVTEAMDAAVEETADNAGGKLKIAMVLPGVITDQSWNTLAYDALMDYQDQGYEVAYTESVAVSDVETTLRTYADQGYDLIFAHGGQFADAACVVGADYPDTYFFVTNKCPDEQNPTSNVGFFYGKEYEAAYLSGIAAAMMSQSGVIGFVGGIEQPSQIADKYGYIAGAESVNPDITVIPIMAGTFDDSALGKESAQALLEQGADVIMHTCDTTGLGVIEACKDAGAYVIGYGSDQAELAPEQIITCCVTDTAQVIKLQASKIEDGSFGSDGINWEPGIAEGVVYVTDFSDFVPQDVVDAVNDAKDKIVSGELVVEKVEENK